jgi:hypothetical protein
VEVELCLQAEVEKICLGEVEDVVGIGPGRGCDRDRRVKPRNSKFQNAPQVVVAVVGFVSDRCEDRAHLGGERSRDKPREELHKTFTHSSIPNEAEARGTESFEPVLQDNSIKRHERQRVPQTNLLETVVKANHIVYLQGSQLRKD